MPQIEDSYTSSAPITRYVEHPGRSRARRAGRRNLAWGVAFLVAAVCVAGIALFVGGPRALLPPALFLASFTALWVLARLKIFGQRNGVFFGLAIISLLGAGAALMEQAWHRLSLRPAFASFASEQAKEPMSVTITAPELPYLSEAYRLDTPIASLPRVRAGRDLTTQIGGKTYRIRRGETFQLTDEKNGEFLITVGEFIARVPIASMEQMIPERATVANVPVPVDDGKGALEKAVLAKVTKRSQEEAVKRFPALGRSGSAENKMFIEAHTDLKRIKSELLDDPEWPVQLAEILAGRYGWQEAGAVDPTKPEVVEPTMAPGTKMLADPTEAAGSEPLIDPAPKPAVSSDLLPESDSDIPPPPKGPQ